MENTAIHDPKATEALLAKRAKQKKEEVHDLAYMRDKDAQLVTGIFKSHECKGDLLKFVYKKYKGEKLQYYEMHDGQVYKIPLGVAKHLNNNCWFPTHAYVMDKDGNPTQRATQKNKRYSFQSLEFMEFEDFDRGGQQIITVENMAIPA